MEAALRATVRSRASDRCEYCKYPQEFDALPFQVDHIIAEKHHGATILENLAWSCCNCNAAKGPNIAGMDLATGQLTRLFHPRNDVWEEHFVWQGALLVGLTAIGRTTVDVLGINLPEHASYRQILLDAGLMG
jgi:hypothetical protein